MINVQRKRALDAAAQTVCRKALRALRAYLQPREILGALERSGVGVSPVNLSRYLSGSVLPSPERALRILEAVYREGLASAALKRAVEVDQQGIVNVPLVAYNRLLVELASSVAYLLFRGRVDAVVTAAVNGVPLATTTASFLDAKLAVARRERESPTLKYFEAGLLLRDPPSYVHLYLPADALRRGDRVLVADDLFRSGRTLRALVKIAEEANTQVVGGIAMLALGEAWREVAPPGAEFVTLLQL